ncbi:MAG: hypothetical protein ACRDSR_24255 [Pseudonocardiaceae bacterium]
MTMPPPPDGYPAGQAPLRGTRPKEVDTSFWLWLTTVALGFIGVLGSYPQLERLQREAAERALAEDPTLDRSSMESVMAAVPVVVVVIVLLFVLAELVVVFLMRGGRNWARIVLAVLGGLGVLFGLIGLTAGGLASIGSLLQLLILGGAIVTMFLPPANAWFRPQRPEF